MNTKKKYIIIGKGVTGQSCIKFLTEKNINFIALDTREEPLENHQTLILQADTIIVSPGVSTDNGVLQLAIKKGIDVIGDIELFARHVGDTPVIGITGSNGKSTVTRLLGDMALEAGINVGVGGNIGIPALSLLGKKHELYILELSSFQLETTFTLKLAAAVILNITPDHMDRYNNFADYVKAKLRIYKNADAVVVNKDCNLSANNVNVPNIIEFSSKTPSSEKQYGVSTENGSKFLCRGNNNIIDCSKIKIMGAHNIINALAATALAEQVNIPQTAIKQALIDFKGLEHRCEIVETSDKILWVNDSKGTSVDATIASLTGLASQITGKWIIILGGDSKNADLSPLLVPVEKYCKGVVLMGRASDELYQLLNNKIKCDQAQSMTDAVKIAKQNAMPGDGILLSPACTSLDMFDNFEHRGKVFKETIDLTAETF